MIEFIVTYGQPDGTILYLKIRLTDWVLESTPERLALALDTEKRYLTAELRKGHPDRTYDNPHVTTRVYDADGEIECRPLRRAELVAETYLRWLLGAFGPVPE